MPAALRRLVASEEVYGTTLFMLAWDTWGKELLQWHPATLRMEMEARCAVKLPKANFDRLMAAVTIVGTDLFFTDADVFIKLVNVLAFDAFDPLTWDIADSAECAWAITEARLLSPFERDEELAEDIRHYLTAILKEEGYIRPPAALKMAIDADFSAQVRYDYADDPAFFSGVVKLQSSKTAEIDALVRDNLLELLQQVQALPLKNGSTAGITQQIRQLETALAASQTAS